MWLLSFHGQKGEAKCNMQDNNSTESGTCKEPDVLRQELEDKFKPKKEQALFLTESYSRLDLDKRAGRVYGCGTYLEFRQYETGEHRLNKANFCKDRLCPMCAWRRSLKVFGQLSQIMEVVRNDFHFLFLTLSYKNCRGDGLPGEISHLLDAYYRFQKMPAVKRAFQGLFRSIEVTRDTEPVITPWMWYGSRKAHRKPKRAYYEAQGLRIGDPNPTFDTYNAHLHVVVAVNPSYFTSRDYISQPQLIQLWRQAGQVDYDPTAHIQKVTDKGLQELADIDISAAIAEVAKYSVKSSDYIVRDRFGNVREDITDSGVISFLAALSSRRLYSYSGIFKKVAAELGITDNIDADLINTDTGELLAPELSYVILKYSWLMGCYCLVGSDRHVNIDIMPD